MISRRGFAGCGICAGLGLLASSVSAQQPNPGFTRTVLDRAEVGGTQFDTIQITIEIDPNANVARHTHPGTESGSVLDGESVLSVQGKPDRTLKAGESYFIPTGVPHSVANGGKKTRLVATYVVDRTKPLASPA